MSSHGISPNGASGTHGVKVLRVIEDQSPMKLVYEPTHPMANPDGFVTMPNVNVVEEMVDMISASRSYQNNVDMMNTAKTLLLKTLTIGQ
jgi:flagellar basal-body rod protein FlgC